MLWVIVPQIKGNLSTTFHFLVSRHFIFTNHKNHPICGYCKFNFIRYAV